MAARLAVRNFILPGFTRLWSNNSYSPSVRLIHAGFPRLAGHSHWQNIKSTKEAKDKARCAVISSYATKIRKLIQVTGNPDPKTNSELAKLIEEARGRNVTKDTIERAVKSAASRAGVVGKVYTLEVHGPGGVALLVEVETDKLSRTKSELGWMLKKNGGAFAENNSLRHTFTEKGMIDASIPAALRDKIEDVAIEAGAEDFSILDENSVRFVCEAAELFRVHGAIKSLGFLDASASNEFLPNFSKDLDDSQIAGLKKLTAVLEEHAEVLRIFDNSATPSAVEDEQEQHQKQ